MPLPQKKTIQKPIQNETTTLSATTPELDAVQGLGGHLFLRLARRRGPAPWKNGHFLRARTLRRGLPDRTDPWPPLLTTPGPPLSAKAPLSDRRGGFRQSRARAAEDGTPVSLRVFTGISEISYSFLVLFLFSFWNGSFGFGAFRVVCNGCFCSV